MAPYGFPVRLTSAYATETDDRYARLEDRMNRLLGCA
jgi:hypothetical protein